MVNPVGMNGYHLGLHGELGRLWLYGSSCQKCTLRLANICAFNTHNI